jgi:hypothetical protein
MLFRPPNARPHPRAWRDRRIIMALDQRRDATTSVRQSACTAGTQRVIAWLTVILTVRDSPSCGAPGDAKE